jgi:predicted dithiol-disulfide oxidoreductase (DUF899 family)
MQPPHKEFFTLFSKANSNVVESGAILMEFAAVRHERCYMDLALKGRDEDEMCGMGWLHRRDEYPA